MYDNVWQLLGSVKENYYKVWQVIQTVTGIKKCDINFKVRRNNARGKVPEQLQMLSIWFLLNKFNTLASVSLVAN